MDGRPQLRRLIDALDRGRPVPDDVAVWFRTGIERFRGGGGDLATALALHSSRALRQARNDHLRKAGLEIGTDVPATRRARQIEWTARKLECFLEEPESIERFIRNRWEIEVFRAIQNAPLPAYDTIRKLMP